MFAISVCSAGGSAPPEQVAVPELYTQPPTAGLDTRSLIHLASDSWLPVFDPGGVFFVFAVFVLYIFQVYVMSDVPGRFAPTQV
jgi:hypothetical protein